MLLPVGGSKHLRELHFLIDLFLDSQDGLYKCIRDGRVHEAKLQGGPIAGPITTISDEGTKVGKSITKTRGHATITQVPINRCFSGCGSSLAGVWRCRVNLKCCV